MHAVAGSSENVQFRLFLWDMFELKLKSKDKQESVLQEQGVVGSKQIKQKIYETQLPEELRVCNRIYLRW